MKHKVQRERNLTIWRRVRKGNVPYNLQLELNYSAPISRYFIVN